MIFPHGETITLHRLVPRTVGGQRQYDAYGAPLFDRVSTDYSGIAIWPISSTETAPPRSERTRTGYVVAMPPDTPVDAIDVVSWRGVDWRVEGEAELFSTPLSASTGLITFDIYRVEG